MLSLPWRRLAHKQTLLTCVIKRKYTLCSVSSSRVSITSPSPHRMEEENPTSRRIHTTAQHVADGNAQVGNKSGVTLNAVLLFLIPL